MYTFVSELKFFEEFIQRNNKIDPCNADVIIKQDWTLEECGFGNEF